MSEEVFATKASGHGVGKAVGGVVFTDLIGVLLFAIPTIGSVLGLATMFAAGPVAWYALEEHPRRRALTWWFGICNAAVLIAVAIAVVFFAIFVFSTVQFG